ncbi:SHOCT domain-containing protein [Herbiconiux sp. CPCC 205763]|uniref:SHOCT domain-containing protein n=1 Tax=Herbiconiux aconitum TaxID=2970913 RepID=A0ABT2GRA7_9MICO|nr:SHOCT domain-containing protein [Herbiconiux aconitum]MCS5718718.1 SHOCT domain-containing protein [Herbiconiux aconitum]
MNFWDLMVTFFWTFAFIAYLMVLFSIIGDIFRDQKLGGFAKAVWIVFLVFVPFLTALVYLIARGRGMNERSAASARAARADTDAYIRSVSGSSPANDVAQAKSLLDSGAITQAEFEVLKAKALGTTAASSVPPVPATPAAV